MIRSHFSYSPLAWMFHSRKWSKITYKVHERSFEIVTSDKLIDFKTLLSNMNKTNFHQKNLRILMVQVFKIIYGYTPPIMGNLLVFWYNASNFNKIPLLWAILPNEHKIASSLGAFKRKIKDPICEIFLCKFI